MVGKGSLLRAKALNRLREEYRAIAQSPYIRDRLRCKKLRALARELAGA